MIELPKDYNFKEVEKKWQDYWEKERIFAFDPASKKLIYSVDTPPPTVSGKMHLGHALGYSQPDFIIRYKRMRGFNVFYPFGFDDNGLATERYVEKKLNIKGNRMPRPEFVKLCLKETTEVEKELKNAWKSVGIAPDWNIFYRTIGPEVQRISQLSFLDLYKIGREYRKEAPTIWCPTCQTAIAQVELQDKETSSVFNDLVFQVEGQEIIIATTRPELLPACVAVFVHPADKRYKHLIGKKAKVPLFNYEVPILTDEKANPEKGTGIVMCCTFGDQTDMEWYSKHKLPLRIAITRDGKMTDIAQGYKDLPIKEAREKIIAELKNQNLLRNQKPITHVVNVHERCGTEIEILETKQWFIKYLDLKEKFLKEGAKLNWYPDFMKVRYDNWVKGLQWDWCISRQRFFGVPFPVWYCKKCKEIILADEKDLPVDPTVHKPKKPCKCGSNEFEPEVDVLDTWATSSLTPQILLKWKSEDKVFNKMFPMSLRPNSHDIITFWDFNTIVKSLLHENKLPWKDVMINGFVLDPQGKKMSKSKGNVIDPLVVLDKYGADALRFWAAGSRLGSDMPYQEKDLVTGRKMVTKLWNASKFAIMHLEDYRGHKGELELIDRWVLSKYNDIVKESIEYFDNYEFFRTKASVENFFWNTLCDYYLEIIKPRLYNPDVYGKESRTSAQHVLYTVMLGCLKLLAPIMPHITEEIYHLHFNKIDNNKSLHISTWPEYDKDSKDKEAEEAGDMAVRIIGAARKFKSEKNLSLKTELKEMLIETNAKNKKLIMKVEKDILMITLCKKLSFAKADVEVAENLKVGLIL